MILALIVLGVIILVGISIKAGLKQEFGRTNGQRKS